MNRRVLPFAVLLIFHSADSLFPMRSADSGGLRINELQSANALTLADSDGDYPDWIEIVNPGPAEVQTAGIGLSDDSGRPFKWTPTTSGVRK